MAGSAGVMFAAKQGVIERRSLPSRGCGASETWSWHSINPSLFPRFLFFIFLSLIATFKEALSLKPHFSHVPSKRTCRSNGSLSTPVRDHSDAIGLMSSLD